MEILEIPLANNGPDTALIYAVEYGAGLGTDRAPPSIRRTASWGDHHLWHNTLMTGKPLQFYRKILEYGHKKGAWMANCKEIAVWCQKSGIWAPPTGPRVLPTNPLIGTGPTVSSNRCAPGGIKPWIIPMTSLANQGIGEEDQEVVGNRGYSGDSEEEEKKREFQERRKHQRGGETRMLSSRCRVRLRTLPRYPRTRLPYEVSTPHSPHEHTADGEETEG